MALKLKLFLIQRYKPVSGKDKTQKSTESEDAANRLEPEHILNGTMLGRKGASSQRTLAALCLQPLGAQSNLCTRTAL